MENAKRLTLEEILASNDALIDPAHVVARIAALPVVNLAESRAANCGWTRVGEYAGMPVEAYHADAWGKIRFGVCIVRGKYDGVHGGDADTAQGAWENTMQALANHADRA